MNKNINGTGAYGTVYKLPEINKVLKIFDDSLYLAKDLKRMKRIEDQIFEGTAGKEDMPFFGSGILAKGDERNIYYALMPEIIPLNSVRKNDQNYASYDIIASACSAKIGRAHV